MPLLSCSGTRPTNLGVSNGQLAPCPSTPNCVSSDASDADHRVESFPLGASPDGAWRDLLDAVKGLPRTTVVTETADYIHVECASAVFGFVDDLELHRRTSEGVVAVRSAARLGRSDMGVNRRRVEQLRETLQEGATVR